MRVLLYSQHLNLIEHSGLGKAIYHQEQALNLAGVETTFDPSDDYDLIHINTYFPGSYLTARNHRAKGIPVVYHAHSTREDFEHSFKGSKIIAPSFKFWLMLCYRQSDALIAPTPYAKGLLESYGLDHIHVVSNGIDVQSFAPRPGARASFRKKYGYTADDFVVLGIGLYIERKGILDFMDLARRLPDYRFIWFGDLDRKLMPSHIQEAIDSAPPNVKLPGYVPNEEIKEAMQGADVFLMTTHEETEGIPALEAAASRIPIIQRDIPVFESWLKEGVHVHKAKTTEDFERLLRAQAQGHLKDLTEAAFKVAEERDFKKVGQQLKAVYESILS